MTVKGRFSFDTNMLVSAVDRDAGERHQSSKALVTKAAWRGCVLTVQTLAEFFPAATRKNLLDFSHAGAFVRDWLNVFHVVSADDMALRALPLTRPFLQELSPKFTKTVAGSILNCRITSKAFLKCPWLPRLRFIENPLRTSRGSPIGESTTNALP